MAQALTLPRPLDGLSRVAAQASARARAFWRAHPRETAGAGVLGLILAAAIATGGVSTAVAPQRAEAAPPAPPPLILQQIAPEQALKVNSEIPVAVGPNPAASPFVFNGSKDARSQALECLASAAYYEAGNQDTDGERAIAQVVLNRVRHPAFPGSVCGVVYQGSTRPTGCQFTFTCDGSLTRPPDADGWRRAYKVAEAALSGYVYAPVGWATHYHADYVLPTWASSMAKNAIVGAHIFYRWAGTWGQPAVFTQRYAGHEASAAALRTAALSVVHISPNEAQGSAVAQAIRNIPGAEPLKLTPSMRGDKRVAVRFNLIARKASDGAPHEDYAKKFDASNNLKWALSGDGVGENEKPLGAAAPSAGAAVAGAATSGSAATRP